MKKLKIIAVALCLYISNTAFAVIPGFPKTQIDLGLGGVFSSSTQTTACVASGSSATITFTPTCGSFGAGTSNFSTSTKFFTEPGNSGAAITSQNVLPGQVTFQMLSYADAGAQDSRYPTGRIYVDYVCKYDSTYTVGVCSGTPITTTVHLSRSGRAHIDFFQTFTALIGTQIIGPDCVKNGDKVTYSIFDFMSGPYTNRDHYRWTKPGSGWDILYYSYDSSSVTYRANTVNSGVDQLSVSIGDCNSNIRTKIISSPGVVAAPTIVKSYCINPATATTWNVAFMTNAPVAGVTYSWDIAASGAGFTYASGSSTTQGAITVNIGSTPSGYILFRASKVVGSGCPNAEHVDTIKFSRALPGTINGSTCVTVGTPQTYTVTGVPATTSITWTLPSGVTPTGTVTTTGSSSITVTPTSTLNYGSINATGASGGCAGTITGLNNINPIPTLSAIGGPVCAARNATVSYTATGSGYENISWTVFGASPVTGSTPFSVTIPSTFTGGVISAVANKGTCTSASVSYPVKWDASGITLTALTADQTCINTGSSVTQTITYTTDAGYDTYTWNLPTGWSGTSTTNSIAYTTNGTAGTVSVTAKNSTCGSTNSKSLTLPVAASVTVTNSGVVNGVVTLSVPTGAAAYKWYKNGVDLGVSTNFLILPVTGTVNNTYWVDVTSSTGCVGRGTSTSTSSPSARIANIDEIQTTDATALTVTPNPASKIVDIKFGSALAGQAYTVLNMSGQQVASGTFVPVTSLDVSNWADGMYVLRSGNTSVKIQVTK